MAVFFRDPRAAFIASPSVMRSVNAGDIFNDPSFIPLDTINSNYYSVNANLPTFVVNGANGSTIMSCSEDRIIFHRPVVFEDEVSWSGNASARPTIGVSSGFTGLQGFAPASVLPGLTGIQGSR